MSHVLVTAVYRRKLNVELRITPRGCLVPEGACVLDCVTFNATLPTRALDAVLDGAPLRARGGEYGFRARSDPGSGRNPRAENP
eukprot:5719840-Prymnesium_polylepis.1